MSGREQSKQQPSMAESARYEIRVRGHVAPSTARRLRGLTVENGTDGQGAAVATLRGELPDQAALMGVLHTLNDDQLPLVSARYWPASREGGDRWRSLDVPEDA